MSNYIIYNAVASIYHCFIGPFTNSPCAISCTNTTQDSVIVNHLDNSSTAIELGTSARSYLINKTIEFTSKENHLILVLDNNFTQTTSEIDFSVKELYWICRHLFSTNQFLNIANQYRFTDIEPSKIKIQIN